MLLDRLAHNCVHRAYPIDLDLLLLQPPYTVSVELRWLYLGRCDVDEASQSLIDCVCARSCTSV